MERPTSSGPRMMEGQTSTGPRLWNTLPQVDQDYGIPSLKWTKIWNTFPRVDQEYGAPSLKRTNIMERPPSSGPRLWKPSLEWTKIWNALPQVYQEHTPSSGPRLWNTFPPKDHDNGTRSSQVDQGYGTLSLE